MKLNKRQFIKGAALVGLVAASPAILARKDEVVEVSYLDSIVRLYGIDRQYGESDNQLRGRLSTRYQQPLIGKLYE